MRQRSIADGVAVIVPCHNAAGTLSATLASVVNQTDAREIVVVDDGSVDDTLVIAARFEPRVRVLTGPNRGVSEARNRGLAETTAPWVLFLDSDDLLEPDTIALRRKKAEALEADVLICRWREIHDDGAGVLSEGPLREIDWAALQADPELATARDVWATTAAILYRRDLVEQIGGFRVDLPVIQDARLLFDAACHGARIRRLDHVGAAYRVLPASLSRRNPARFWGDILLNGQQIEAVWRARGALSAAQREVIRGIYDSAARGLLAAGDASFLEAVAAQRKLGLPLPLHTRLTPHMVRMLGVKGAQRVVSWLARA